MKADGVAEPTGPSKHVLLLDGEEAVLRTTANYFRSLGCKVDVARRPEEVEALLGQRRYDLAILGLYLTGPGTREGLDLMREIRRRDHTTSVILLSTYVSHDLETEARALGAAGVLSKPQSLPDLAQLALGLMGAPRE